MSGKYGQPTIQGDEDGAMKKSKPVEAASCTAFAWLGGMGATWVLYSWISKMISEEKYAWNVFNMIRKRCSSIPEEPRRSLGKFPETFRGAWGQSVPLRGRHREKDWVSGGLSNRGIKIARFSEWRVQAMEISNSSFCFCKRMTWYTISWTPNP